MKPSIAIQAKSGDNAQAGRVMDPPGEAIILAALPATEVAALMGF